MKFIGFIKEEDKNIKGAKSFEEMFSAESVDRFLRNRVIEYLSNGVFLTGVMTYIYDNEGKPIGNLDYFTDGKFIWPVYYVYYLRKYDNFLVVPELLSHAQENNFTVMKINSVELSAMCNELDAEWAGY